ncbi:hypothetical protein PV325_007831, partial [Microctonus aethiopoides]
MSQKDTKIKHEWQIVFNEDSYSGCEFETYSNVFTNSLIPGVKFEILCCVSRNEICHVVLSKTPHTPVNATITMEPLGKKQIEKKDVDRWTDNCIFKFKFQKILQNLRHHNVPSVIKFQCNITWRVIEIPKPQVLGSSCDRFKNFLITPDLSDMTIVIDETEFPVHKIILAAYSPVFLAMFKTDMTESVNKRVVITDIEPDIMDNVIEFMYTGAIDPIPKFNDLLSILEVADKYEIKILKELCAENLSENITIDNVLKILERASLYGVPQLVETVISFMVKKKLQIVALENFSDLYRRKPEL